MQLELNSREVEDLWRALDSQVHFLQAELTHSDSADYKKGMREVLDRMEALRERVRLARGEPRPATTTARA